VAAAMDGHVAKNVVQERFDRLVELQTRISLESNQARVGRREEVLVEGPSKKDPEIMTARTRGNQPVHAPGRFEPGAYLGVEITKAAPHHLMGRVIS
jgi:tRNA-2-methylthio-N6-dimethylallyladenosine synthase